MTEAVMPRLLRHARGGVTYTNAYANGCGTPDSFPALFASRLAEPFAGVIDIDPDEAYALRPDDVTLAEVLRDAGYQTAAFVAGNPYLGRRYGYDRGFEHFEAHQPASLVDRLTGSRLRGAMRRMAARLPWSPYPGADTITAGAREFLASRSAPRDAARPFFLWLHYMDAHFPTLPPGRRGLSARRAAWSPIRGEPEGHHELLVELYRASLRHIDHELSQLLDELPQPTVVAFTSDHGQLFGEHGSYWHNGVWEQLLRVPLFIVAPAGTSGTVVEEIVQLLDLPPQLLGMLGVESPAGWQGTRLVAPPGGIHAVSNDPERRSYSEAHVRADEKTVRTPSRSWTFKRGEEPLELVAA